MTKKAITSFDDLVQAWTNRMMELDHKVTANRRSIEGLENQIDETYKEMEDIEKVAHDLLGDKVQFNLYENEDNAIRILYKSHSMVEPKVNIVKDRKIQVGKEPKQFEKSYFDTDIEQTVTDEETGSWSSIKQGFIGVDEYGKPIQGLKVSVGNTDSEAEPETQHYRVRVPESVTEEPDEGVQFQSVYGHLSRDSEENTSDKSPVLSEEDGTQDMTMKEYHDLSESANKLIGRLDEDYLEKLHINLLEGSFMFDMKDFHSLVAQLYMIQESHKRKGNG